MRSATSSCGRSFPWGRTWRRSEGDSSHGLQVRSPLSSLIEYAIRTAFLYLRRSIYGYIVSWHTTYAFNGYVYISMSYNMYVYNVCIYVCMYVNLFSESFALRQQDIWKEIASFSSLTVGNYL